MAVAVGYIMVVEGVKLVAVEEGEGPVGRGRRATAAGVERTAAEAGELTGKWLRFARTGKEPEAAWDAGGTAGFGQAARAGAGSAGGGQVRRPVRTRHGG